MTKLEITCVADLKCQIGEGIFWDAREQALYFVDIKPGHLFRLGTEAGAPRRWEFNEPLGCLALDESGNAVLALKSGIKRYEFASGAVTLLAHPEASRPLNRFNDGSVDAAGRFWTGTMAMDPPPVASGAFYRLDQSLETTAFFDGAYTTNGLAFSPDQRLMYFSDSNPSIRNVYVCDYDAAAGTPHGKRLFFDTREVAGRPDGATVDADGCYWMAGVGGWQVVRITPQGKVDRIIDLPVERPSRPAFGGAKLNALYVTSLRIGLTPGSEARQPQAGGVFRIDGIGVTGLAQPRFAG